VIPVTSVPETLAAEVPVSAAVRRFPAASFASYVKRPSPAGAPMRLAAIVIDARSPANLITFVERRTPLTETVQVTVAATPETGC
jgi:hypothetical protein